jgi:predicted phage terminase large subunit-like protein
LKHGKWSIVYERAIRDDGSLFFPKRLHKDFLDDTRKTQGSYIFANQYQNEVIPEDAQNFKKQWLRYFDVLPEIKTTFSIVDPAISQEATSDFTAVVIVHVDVDGNWYLDVAQRYRITPTNIVEKIFEVHKNFSPNIIGVESVAYQKALLYMLDEEMRRRGTILNVMGVKPDKDEAKRIRILGLVPRFEWGRIFVRRGLFDFEDEYSGFPRAKNDDLLDALAYIEKIAYLPEKEKDNDKPPPINSPGYEAWYIKNITKINERRTRTELD